MGQAKHKQRDCPAIGRVITSADCGEHRGSQYSCPATCPHNPWAPDKHARALEIEDGLMGKMLERLADEHSTTGPGNDAVAQQQFYVMQFFRQRDANGLTFGDRWARAGWRGLNNDERVLFQRHAQMHLALVEVHRIGADGQCEVVDLLAPTAAPFLIRDDRMAASATRFVQALVWTFPMPYFQRTHGVGLFMPEVNGLDGPDVLREVARHLGGPDNGAALRDWLEQNIARVEAAFTATNLAMRKRTMETLDAKWCAATYRLRYTNTDVLRRLGFLDGVQLAAPTDDERAAGFENVYEWFDDATPLEPGQLPLELTIPARVAAGRPLLGRVLVARKSARLEAGSAARYQALRARFEKRLGNTVTFESERVDDLGARLAQKTPDHDAALVPPRLLEGAMHLVLSTSRVEPDVGQMSPAEATAFVARRQAEQFLDERVPLLGGLTPRQAAADPARRPVLVPMLKKWVRHHDQRNLETGGADDINWLLRELGLTELLFDPPPPRPVLESHEPALNPAETAPLALEPPPPLPDRPLTEDEVLDRLDDCQLDFPSPTEALDELEAVAPDLVEFLDGATAEELNDGEWTLLLVTVAQAWFVFFPFGTGPARLDLDRFDGALSQAVREIQHALGQSSPAAFQRGLATGCQPALLAILAATVADAAQHAPKRDRIRLEVVPLLLALLKTVIAELDHAARQ